jgi:hypothetical protein
MAEAGQPQSPHSLAASGEVIRERSSTVYIHSVYTEGSAGLSSTKGTASCSHLHPLTPLHLHPTVMPDQHPEPELRQSHG